MEASPGYPFPPPAPSDAMSVLPDSGQTHRGTRSTPGVSDLGGGKVTLPASMQDRLLYPPVSCQNPQCPQFPHQLTSPLLLLRTDLCLAPECALAVYHIQHSRRECGTSQPPLRTVAPPKLARVSGAQWTQMNSQEKASPPRKFARVAGAEADLELGVPSSQPDRPALPDPSTLMDSAQPVSPACQWCGLPRDYMHTCPPQSYLLGWSPPSGDVSGSLRIPPQHDIPECAPLLACGMRGCKCRCHKPTPFAPPTPSQLHQDQRLRAEAGGTADMGARLLHLGPGAPPPPGFHRLFISDSLRISDSHRDSEAMDSEEEAIASICLEGAARVSQGPGSHLEERRQVPYGAPFRLSHPSSLSAATQAPPARPLSSLPSSSSSQIVPIEPICFPQGIPPPPTRTPPRLLDSHSTVASEGDAMED